MAEAATLWIRIKGEAGEAARAFQETERAARQAANGIQGVAGQIKSALERAAEPSQKLLGWVGKLGAAGGVALAAFGGAAVKAAADMEQTRMAFTTLLGSAEKAQAFLGELADFAARTPFELQGLTDASRKLLAFGFQAEEIIPTMRAVGDAVAAVGGGAAEIDRVVYALGQMRAKGKVSAEEMMQIAELGIPAWQMLADRIGVSVPEAMERVSKGTVDAATGISAILEGMGSRFAGAMEAQSNTIIGRWSTMKDSIKGILRGVGEEIIKAFDLGGVLERLNQSLGRFADLVGEKGLKGAIAEIVPPWVAPAIVAVAGAITGALVPALVTLARTLLTQVIPSFLGAMAPLLPFMAAGAAVAALAYVLIKNWGALAAFFTQLWQDLKTTVVAAVTAVKDWLSAAWAAIQEAVAGAWEAIKNAVVTRWLYLVYTVEFWLTYLKGMLAVAWETIKGAVEEAWEAVKNAVVARWLYLVYTLEFWLTYLKGMLSLAWEAIRGAAAAAWDAICGSLVEKWQNLKARAEEIWNGLKDWLFGTWEEVKTAAAEKWEAIKSTIGGLVDAVETWATTTWNRIGTFLSTTWEAIKSWAGEKWEGIKQAVTAPMEAAAAWLEGTWSKVKNTLASLWDSAAVLAREKWNAVKEAIRAVVNAIIDLVNKFIRWWNRLEFAVPKYTLPGGIEFGGWSIRVPRVPEIPHLAAGGVVQGPTLAMLGEAGPEAVVPLRPTAPGLDVLADVVAQAVYQAVRDAIRISRVEQGAGQAPRQEIVLQVDATRLGRVILPAFIREGQRIGLTPVLRPEGR